MSVTYTDQVRPAAPRVDSDAYVPVYARSGARKSNKPVKTWMVLAPLGVLVVGGAAAAMLMQPAETTAPATVEAAPIEAPLAMAATSPLTAPSVPIETPADLATAAPIPPAAAAPVERRAAPPTPAPARAVRAAPPAAAPVVEAPVPTGPQPYLSVAPEATPVTVAPPAAAPVTPAAPPAPIVITPTN
ncbi:hypothetical protein [Brevundimonas sp.]|uniref:hypothetical protein n=1 Tax=Brevundimonas sp. TaxID=1871086 RepID=UPI0028AD345B|nr:hypothetical protein [Brevundimonas sp.]